MGPKVTKTIRTKIRTIRGPDLVCLSSLDIGLIFFIAVLVFLMGQNPKCPGYNYWKNQGDKYIFNV